jgi:hypothetical protein
MDPFWRRKNPMIRTLTALALCAGASLISTSAFAQSAPPPTAVAPAASSDQGYETMDPSGWSGQVLLGYGFNSGVDLGLGVRFGYTLPMHVYVGGTFIYHFGSDNVNVYYPGIEGGYDIIAGPVVVRPYLGLGPVFEHFSGASVDLGGFGTATVPSTTNTEFGIWPGVNVLYPITNQFFVGGDARFLIVSDYNTFSLFVNGGMHF